LGSRGLIDSKKKETGEKPQRTNWISAKFKGHHHLGENLSGERDSGGPGRPRRKVRRNGDYGGHEEGDLREGKRENKPFKWGAFYKLK